MNLILSAVHIDVEDIGIFSKEVPGAVPEMGIDIHDEEALQAHLPQTADGYGYIIKVAESPAAAP